MSQTLVNNQTISLGQTITVPIPPAPNPAWSWVQVQNASPYEVQVLGGPTSALIVASGWQETINLSGVEPQVTLTAGGNASAATGSLTVVIGTSLDVAPPSGPLPASTTATIGYPVTTNLQVQSLGSFTIPAGGGTVAVSLTVNASWAQSIIAAVQGSGAQCLVQVMGATTGLSYNPWVGLADATNFQSALSCSVAPALDSSIDFVISSLGNPNGSLSVWASAGPPLPLALTPYVYYGYGSMTTPTTTNLYTPSTSYSVVLIEQMSVVVTGGSGTGDYAHGAIQAANLATATGASDIATVLGAWTQPAMGQAMAVEPLILTYPGSYVVLSAVNSSTTIGGIDGMIRYRKLIP